MHVNQFHPYVNARSSLCLLFVLKLRFSRMHSLASAHQMRDFTDFRQSNFTKFEHNTSISVAMNPFETEF